MDLKLLIVDDSPVVRAELANLLTLLAGVTVVGEAADGQAAINQCATFQPDVVLMDLEMPGMDGIEATRRIKHGGLTGKCKVIILTVYGSQTNQQKALASGADAFVLKGTDLESLASTLARVTQGSSQTTQVNPSEAKK